jgi:lysophospholipase L1-like esterase
MKEIIFIGDSLIEWFDWDKRFTEHKVLNLGISGETIEMLLDRLPYVIERHPGADLVFIMTGINNVAMEDTGIITPYKSIIKRMHEGYPEAVIHLTSLLPTLLDWIPDKTITQLNSMIAELTGDASTLYDDIYSHFKKEGVQECLSEDGIHINPRGYEVWSKAIEPIVGA